MKKEIDQLLDNLDQNYLKLNNPELDDFLQNMYDLIFDIRLKGILYKLKSEGYLFDVLDEKSEITSYENINELIDHIEQLEESEIVISKNNEYFASIFLTGKELNDYTIKLEDYF